MDGVVDFAAAIKQCARERDVEAGRRAHGRMPIHLRSGTYLGNLLASMYGKCGCVDEAREAFDCIANKNVMSYTIMIGVYARNGDSRSGLHLSLFMHLEGVKPDAFTFSTLIAACSSSVEGKAIHEQARSAGMLDECNIVVGNSLIGLYARCGELDQAWSLFQRMLHRDVLSWNTMLTAFARKGHSRDALQLFYSMLQEGQEPNEKTFVAVVGACARLRALSEGKKMHSYVVGSGFMSCTLVANSLVNMYGKCGSLDDARKLVDAMEGRRTTGTWNALITAYAQIRPREALELFFSGSMDAKPNYVTFVSLLTACTSLGSVDMARRVHRCIAAGDLETQIVVGNAVVNMFGKIGMLGDAQGAFDSMEKKDIISWNALLSAYARHGCGSEALLLFRRMDLEGIKQDLSTYTSALDACVMVEALELGQQIHSRIQEFRKLDDVLGTALLNLYGKCARLDDAVEIFSRMKSTDVVSWNAMIAVYSQRGHSQDALRMFWELLLEGIYPDEATFISIFFACSHAGLFVDGWAYFVSLTTDFDELRPNEEHYRCMVDLLGRAGHLGRAEEMIRQMPSSNSRVAWMSLLSASQQQENLHWGMHAAGKLFQMEAADSSSAYVVFSNLIK